MQVTLFYPLHPSLTPSTPGIMALLPCSYMFVFVCFGYLLFLIFMLFIFHMRVKVYSTCHSPPDLFHLAEYPEGPSVLSQMAVFHLFWWKKWLCSILLYIYIIYVYWSGNPLQYPCLENPRDRGAWWAAVYGVAQNQTQLKWFSSSSMYIYIYIHVYIYTFKVY